MKAVMPFDKSCEPTKHLNTSFYVNQFLAIGDNNREAAKPIAIWDFNCQSKHGHVQGAALLPSDQYQESLTTNF
jgi:hypothetical protein